MVCTEPIRHLFLAGNNLLSRRAVLPAAHARRGLYRNAFGHRMAPAMTSVVLSLDTSELVRDLERVESGELELPTVSAVRVSVDGKGEEVPIWLPEA